MSSLEFASNPVFQKALTFLPAMWAEHNKILVDGRPFSFRGHRYQWEPMNCHARRQCARKGAQIGWSTIRMLASIHGLIHNRYPQGVLYLFPTRDDVTDFSKGRFTPLINDNPAISSQVKDTDAANIKRIGKSLLYFRGAKSRSQLKSIPVDRLIFDEVDEMQPSMVDLALERISHSDVKEEEYISTPTIPEYGVDLRWLRSDQRLWMIPCRKCNHETCLELEFELNGWQDQQVIIWKDDRVIRACGKCHEEIFPDDGHWVPQFPSRTKDLVGWWISQLNSAMVEPETILDAFADPKRNIAETYNSKIGMPYVEAENRLTVEEVLRCCGSDYIASSDRGPCSMGVDQGKDLHVVVGKRHETKLGKLVHLGVYKDWEELDRLMENFNVSRAVVDALPETRNARAFAERFPGRVYLNYYNEKQRGAYAWNEFTMTVSCNRTESLDASHMEMQGQQLEIPQESILVKEFAKQCHNTAKKLEEDEETGSKRYIYVKLGADHFRHALNYEVMARAFCSNSIFA